MCKTDIFCPGGEESDEPDVYMNRVELWHQESLSSHEFLKNQF